MKNSTWLFIFCFIIMAVGLYAQYNKNMQFSERHYHIQQFSGGKLIGDYQFKGILNDSKGSDGYFFFRGDTLIEVSGDLTIKSVD